MDDTVSTALGEIAQTAGPGSNVIVSSFYIVSRSTPVVGDSIIKIGRSSGWTEGVITETDMYIFDFEGPGKDGKGC